MHWKTRGGHKTAMRAGRVEKAQSTNWCCKRTHPSTSQKASMWQPGAEQMATEVSGNSEGQSQKGKPLREAGANPPGWSWRELCCMDSVLRVKAV